MKRNYKICDNCEFSEHHYDIELNDIYNCGLIETFDEELKKEIPADCLFQDLYDEFEIKT